MSWTDAISHTSEIVDDEHDLACGLSRPHAWRSMVFPKWPQSTGTILCPLSDIHLQNLKFSLSIPVVLTIPRSVDASKWPPGTCILTVFTQEAMVSSSSRRCDAEGAGSKGTVLKYFLSSDTVGGGSTVASVFVPGKSTPASLISKVRPINNMNTKQMGETLLVGFMLCVSARPYIGEKATKYDGHGDLSRNRIVGGL